MQFTGRLRVTKIERPDHDGDTELTTVELTYTKLGLLETSKDPLGRETNYLYDEILRQTKVILPEVANPATAIDEIQIIDFDSGTEGTFKLNGNTKSGTIDLADTSDFQVVLDGLWGAGSTSVVVTATEATVTFRGPFAAILSLLCKLSSTSSFAGKGGVRDSISRPLDEGSCPIATSTIWSIPSAFLRTSFEIIPSFYET